MQQTAMASQDLFINCPRGLESLLMAELAELGAANLRETVAGVHVTGAPAAFAYRACLWSRLANRVLLPLARIEGDDADSLYRGVMAVNWSEHLDPDRSIAVDFAGRSDAIRHSRFGAQRVKDAVVDQFVASGGARPRVDTKNPDVRINAYLARGRVALSLDLSGESLHRRGYRVQMVPAPLKENLAAALLIRAGWPEIAAAGGALVDPLCGSGTLLIEAAMMAADIAPGLWRRQFGFHHWKQFDGDLWQQLTEEALQRKASGLAAALPEIRGYDKDARAITAAEANIAAAGLERVVRVSAKPVSALKRPTHKAIGTGLLITNPPYGERWGEIEELRPLYEALGSAARAEFPGWRLAVITGNKELAGELRLRADKSYAFFNGTIPAKLYLYQLREESLQLKEESPQLRDESPQLRDESLQFREKSLQRGEKGQQPGEDSRQQEAPGGSRPLSEGEQMLVNRIAKNQRRLKSWLVRNGITCYRLYDGDLPEYNVAIDCYGDALHIQEYAPPASVDPEVARRRLGEARRALLHIYPGSRDRLFFKERRRQSGDSQYQSGAFRNKGKNAMVVSEGRARLEINLADYLDTGLFLDHRPVREMIAGMARGTRFLNLFCYTATATVHAALGGAEGSLSIDMSNTYLEWAQRNFDLNGINSNRHRLLRADCLEWLASADGEYDLILLDPPTFSNSKNMDEVLDIQRDHVHLVDQAMSILSREGTLLFSNNFRRFKLAPELAQRYRVEDISAASIPPDFERNQRIHHCWRIGHR